MKRGTKITVFIASMALTVGSLVAIVGPRHPRYCGGYGQGGWNTHHGTCGDQADQASCGSRNECQTDSLRK